MASVMWFIVGILIGVLVGIFYQSWVALAKWDKQEYIQHYSKCWDDYHRLTR